MILMNKPLLFLFFLLVSGTLFGADSFSDWNCSQGIDAPGHRKYISITLPKEVYQYAQSGLEDLRIIDSKSNLLPYFIEPRKTRQEEHLSFLEVRSIKREVAESNSRFDFQLLKTTENIPVSRLMVKLTGNNYSKQIEIYGRDDTTDWKWLTTDTVYSLDGISKQEIRLPENSYGHFYRVIIADNAQKYSVTAFQLISVTQTETDLSQAEKIELSFNVSNNGKETVVSIENPYRLKLKVLNLDITGNFFRNCELSATDPDGTGAELISKNCLYRIESRESVNSNTSIHLGKEGISSDHLILTVSNGDDRPLSIRQISAKVCFDRIVFERSDAGPFSLLFGNPSAVKAEFDIQNYMHTIETEDIDEGRMTHLTVKKNSREPQKKPYDFKPFFNVLIILLSAAIVAYLLIQLLRSKPNQ